MSNVTHGEGRFALWLMPAEPALGRLRGFIANLGTAYHTPAFEPHITLLSGIMGDEDLLRRPTAELAGRLAPFEVCITALRTSNEYHRSLFAHVGATDPLVACRRLAENLFRADAEVFHPHLSLMYGEPRGASKDVIVRDAPLVLPECFRLARLALCRTGRPLPDWRLVLSCPLGASSPR